MCDAGLAALFIPLGFLGHDLIHMFLMSFAVSVCYEHCWALDVASCDTMACTLRFCRSLALRTGCVASGKNGTKAVVMRTRVMHGTPRESWRRETQMQIEKTRAKRIGNAFCEHTTPYWSQSLRMLVMLHDLRNIADDQTGPRVERASRRFRI